MLRHITTRLFSTASHSKHIIARTATSPKPRTFLTFTAFALLPATYYLYQRQHQQYSQPFKLPEPAASPMTLPIQQTWGSKVGNVLANMLRLLHLLWIFLPPIVALPLRLFTATQEVWMKMFVSAVERAGVVWIKAFQYMSHRRDVIGPEMAEAFSHLRENAPQHSFEETRRNFKAKYGKQIEEIFDSFDPQPIASGSVSQVYKGVYKGKKVAVKVRHPEVDRYIQRDVQLMFDTARFLSLFSKRFELPVGEESMKRTLFEQINFNVQKDNLITFNHHFNGNKEILFPVAYESETRDSILIQSFVEGKPVTYYEQNKHPLNAYMARLGTTAFFEMLMKNNFIHADCHGGNILVQLTQHESTFLGEIWDWGCEKVRRLEGRVKSLFMGESLRKLYQMAEEEEHSIREMIRKCGQRVKITLIDVGMVIRLSEDDRLNFSSFLRNVVEGNSQKCASLIYSLSNFGGEKILDGQFRQFKNELQRLFSVLDSKSIFEIEGVQLLVGMLDILREHNMKLQGEFATLLTNILVLQSIAKDIDPDIQILKCALPYFQHAPSNGTLESISFPAADNTRALTTV